MRAGLAAYKLMESRDCGDQREARRPLVGQSPRGLDTPRLRTPLLNSIRLQASQPQGRRSVDNVGMRVRGALLCTVFAAFIGATVAGAATPLHFTLRTMQGPTSVASAGRASSAVAETYLSTLTLLNAGAAQLGKPAWAQVGTMRFSYVPRKHCTAYGTVCDKTADFSSVSVLPGGTVLASGVGLSIANPTITIPVVGGTGRYAGASGTVTISPSSTKVSIYRLELP